MQITLSERQRTAVATAITIVASAVIIAATGVSFWLTARFLKAFSHVFLPLAVAAVAALVCRPYYVWLKKKLPATLSLVVLFLSILIPVALFGWFFGALIVDQLSNLIKDIPEIWQRALASLKQRLPMVRDWLQNNPWGQRLQEAVQGQQENLLEGLQFFGGKALLAGAGLLRGLGAALNWAILPVYFAFLLMADFRGLAPLEKQTPFLKESTRQDLFYLIHEFVNIIVAFFRGQLLVALLQGLLFAAGFSLVGLRYGFVLGLLLGFLNIIPYLGSIIGLGVTIPLALFQDGGGTVLLIWVLVVFCVVQLIEGYLLTPKIMGDRTGLHPMAIIFSVFFWGSALNGILGMILAIPLTAFLVVFWRLARDKYIKELV